MSGSALSLRQITIAAGNETSLIGGARKIVGNAAVFHTLVVCENKLIGKLRAARLRH